MHCQQTAEEEDGRGFVLIGRSDWARDWPPLRHWLLAVSLRICCRRFPRHSACTRQARQACIRLETVWSLSEIDKFEDGSFLACLCWFARKLPAENGNSCSPPQTPSRTSRHAQPEIYIFIYFSQINAVKVFFLLQSISKQLFMHRQVRQTPDCKLSYVGALHYTAKKSCLFVIVSCKNYWWEKTVS